jgi:hypothetical protein
MLLADVARRVILVVLFDNRTTLGLVRLKMRQTVEDLSKLFEKYSAAASPAPASLTFSPTRMTKSTACSSNARPTPCR